MTMVAENERIPGAVIRRERLARGIEQKALCKGVCVPSYLSKIERGAAIPNGEILNALYDRLGLPRLDGAATARAGELVGEGYRRALYGLDLPGTLAELEALGPGVGCGGYAADLLILRGWRGEDTLAGLLAMADCLTPAQDAWLELLRWRGGQERDAERLRAACAALGNSLALNDRLLAALGESYHFGHAAFYQDVYLSACKRQRQYRKALQFQRMISNRGVRIID